MRLISFVMMVVAATFVVVVLFLHAPILTLAIKPMQKGERLRTMSSISADDPPPPPLTAAQIARAHSLLAPFCKKMVGAELSRRKLALGPQRFSALCACAVDRIMIARDTDPDDRIEGLSFLITEDEKKMAQRRQLDDAAYMGLVADAEAACAGR